MLIPISPKSSSRLLVVSFASRTATGENQTLSVSVLDMLCISTVGPIKRKFEEGDGVYQVRTSSSGPSLKARITAKCIRRAAALGETPEMSDGQNKFLSHFLPSSVLPSRHPTIPSLHRAFFYPSTRVPCAPELENDICYTQPAEYFHGDPIHRSVHILVDPITRSHGPKPTIEVCASVDGDDHPWMKRRSRIEKRRSIIRAEVGASYVEYISQYLAA